MAARHSSSAYMIDIESGKGVPSTSPADFADAIIRRGFVRKVFGLLAVQLAVTVAIGAAMVGSSSVKGFVATHPSVIRTAFAVSLGTLLYLAFNEKARSSFPTNLILLSLFTVAEGVVVGVATARYDSDIVLLALGITAAVTTSLCLYALTTKSDFTSMGSWLYAALMSMLIAGFVGAVMQTPLFTLGLSCGGAALFSVYIVYDVQMLMGGQHQFKISPDEYVFAAINIYLDIINLFIHILQILNSSRDR